MMEFKPTYLYVKQHSVTGKCYFGKTVRKDPIKYNGSGVHWKSHFKFHGKEHVVTLWHELFDNQEDCTEFALFFSEEMDIVKSKDWLNFKPENGLDGGTSKGHNKGRVASNETRLKMSIARKGLITSEETKAKISAKGKLRITLEETKAKISVSSKNKILSEETKAKISNGVKNKLSDPEIKKKMSLLNKGKTHSIETRNKLSLSQKGISRGPMTEETKAKISASQKLRMTKPNDADTIVTIAVS